MVAPERPTGLKRQGIMLEAAPAGAALMGPMGRIAMEFRASQKAWDILQTTTLNKVPPQQLAPFDPSEAKAILPEARDPGRRWYGLYANYNAPAYNTNLVKASDLPKTYDEFIQHKE